MPKYTRNDDGTLTQETDGGYRALVIDPDGSFEREMSGQAPPGAAEWAASQPHKPANVAPLNQVLSPEDKSALAQPSTVGPTATIVERKESAAPSVAPLAPQAPMAGAPEVVNIAPSSATKSVTDTSSGGSTSGLDDASKKRVLDAGAKVDASQRAMAGQNRAATEQVAAQREQQAKADYMSGFTKQVGALEAQDKYSSEYKAALAESKAARATKLDPTKTFGSERNSWAIIAGIEGALAALDTGISRLQGRQAPPSTLISDMVERSLKMQEDERSQRIAAAGESAEVARDEMLHQRVLANEAAAQILSARKMLAGSAEQRAFLDTEESKLKLAADIAEEERAKAIATRKTSQWSSQTQTKTEEQSGGQMLVVPGSERAAQDQKLIQDTLTQAYPALKPEKAQEQWDEFQKQYVGTAGMRTAVERAKEGLQKYAKTGDVAGFGVLAKRLPTSFASMDAVEQRQAIGTALSMYIKSISGSAASDPEVERLMTNMVGSGDYESMNRGLEALQAQTDAMDREMKKTKPQLHNLAEYLGRRQSDERGADRPVETF
jgi:hypothetical protein